MSGPAADAGSKGDKGDKGIDDETIAKAAGVVIGVGIAWSLIRSFWRRKSSPAPLLETEHQQTDVKTEVCYHLNGLFQVIFFIVYFPELCSQSGGDILEGENWKIVSVKEACSSKSLWICIMPATGSQNRPAR
jgi:hypothetical protein